MLVEYASMTTMFGLTVLERGKRWTAGWDEDVAKYVHPDFSVWAYDWDNEDDTPGSAADFDPAEEIQWEIELVQRWMKGEPLGFCDIVDTCDLVGVRGYLVVSLDHRGEAVIARRYGLEDGEVRTWQQLAEELGVTTERVKQIAAKALEQLVRSDESLALVCSQSSGSKDSQVQLRQLREFARHFWSDELTHFQFPQQQLSLDTLCYLSFLFIVSDYFNIEDPGVIEAPAGSIEVASNIDLLLGTLSRRMISVSPHADFSESDEFDLRQGSWSTLTERAWAADNRLKFLMADNVSVLKEISSWRKTDLLDSLAIAVQIAEIFDATESKSQYFQPSNPLSSFLSQEQRDYGRLVTQLETELKRR